ncbi:MAG: hypothetical protein HY814_06015 [Candidatus Riflebacteria bacterium]|nr:hypothetical protein [Candidatus Riflebacteria bacterium]
MLTHPGADATLPFPMPATRSRYSAPERRGSRVNCPALKRWISERDCEVRRTASYCISCNGCPLKDAGCASCGKAFAPKSPFQVYCCLRCKRDATNRKRLAMRRQWRQQGICIYCGKNSVQAGRSQLGCQACLDMHSTARKSRTSTKAPEKKRPPRAQAGVEASSLS